MLGVSAAPGQRSRTEVGPDEPGVFRYWVADLIDQRLDPADEMLVYANDGDVNATGMNLEFEGRWPGGVAGRASVAL